MNIERKRQCKIFRFVEPYPGESCYSILARCRVYSGYSTRRFVQELTGTILRLDRFLFEPLPYAPSDAALFNMERLVVCHSCLPYSAPLLSGLDIALVQKMRNENELTAGERKRLTRHVGFTHWNKKYLCYCPLCVDQDRKQYGETYWHLVAQLPGVWVCPVHGTKIEESSISVGSLRYDLIPAEFALHKIAVSCEISDDLLKLVATESQWLLINGFQLSAETPSCFKKDTHLSKEAELLLQNSFFGNVKYSETSILSLILFLAEQGKRLSLAQNSKLIL